MTSAAAVAAAIRSRHFRYTSEDRLQEGIAAVLVEDGFLVEREHRLDSRSRLDLLVDGRIGVEVKIGSSTPTVGRQLARYLEYSIDGIVLVTSRAHHVRLASDRVEVVCLNGRGL